MTDQGWKDAVHTGHVRMDAEHQVELALLDALHEAVSRDLGPNRVAEVLEQLLEHTNVHFMSEQLLMRLTAYPQYEAHAGEHDELIVKARMLQSHVATGETKPTLALIDSMRNWLVQHIDGKDRALAAYLSGHSGKSVPIA